MLPIVFRCHGTSRVHFNFLLESVFTGIATGIHGTPLDCCCLQDENIFISFSFISFDVVCHLFFLDVDAYLVNDSTLVKNEGWFYFSCCFVLQKQLQNVLYKTNIWYKINTQKCFTKCLPWLSRSKIGFQACIKNKIYIAQFIAV